MKFQGRKIYQGLAQGETLVTSMGISFFGGVDPDSGLIVEKDHELEGQSISGKILVFPTGKGSTVGSFINSNTMVWPLWLLSMPNVKPLRRWAALLPKFLA